MSLDILCSEPTRQPKTVTARLIGDAGPFIERDRKPFAGPGV